MNLALSLSKGRRLGQTADFDRAGWVGRRWQVAIFADVVDGGLAVFEENSKPESGSSLRETCEAGKATLTQVPGGCI